MTFRKWYFAANENALRDSFDMISVAVRSAKQNTSLTAHCLVEDKLLSDVVENNIRILESEGVKIIRHNAEAYFIVENIFGAQRSCIFNGHWLRTDIPILENEEKYILYTDIDVMFRRDIAQSDFQPDFIACAPEHDKDDWSYFNSGVMIMNLPALRATRQEFLETVRADIGKTQPYDDQTMLNICYRDRYSRLPLTWNWKPYWGFSDDAAIVHFHGPKPDAIGDMLKGHIFDGLQIYHEMHARNPEGYEHYRKEYYSYLKSN